MWPNMARAARLSSSKDPNCKITINQTVDYMAPGFMIFMRWIDITQGIERVLLKVEPVLGPEIAQATASAIWAQNRQDS